MTDEDTYYDRGLGGGRNTSEASQFWKAAEEERLLVQRCSDCEEYLFPPQNLCAYCWEDDLEWIEASGRGTVYSFSVVHVGLHSAWSDRLPYVVALIELEEGVFVVSNVVGCDPEDVETGMDVEVTFEALPGEDGVAPQFEPERR